MEDQDQALAAMAGYTEEDPKGDDSVQNRCTVRVPKTTTMESTSTTAQSTSKRKRGSSSSKGEEASEPGRAKRKMAKLAHDSEEIIPALGEDGVTGMNDGDEDESKTKDRKSVV